MNKLFRNNWLVAVLVLVVLAVGGVYLLMEPDGTTESKGIVLEKEAVKREPRADKRKVRREVVGIVTQFKGLVFSQYQEKKRTLDGGDPIFQGDKIITGQRARLILKMKDDAIIALGPDSEFLVRQYQFTSESDVGNGLLELTRGLIKFASGKLAQLRKRPFKIVTPVATLGVRGTEGFVSLNGKGVNQEIEVVTLQKEIVVWMEEGSDNSARSQEIYFQPFFATAYAADTTKDPHSVKKNQALNAQKGKKPTVKKASKKQLKKAHVSTVVKKLSKKTKQKLRKKVVSSFVEKGLAANEEEAEQMLKASPEALNELVEKTENELLDETEKAVDKALDQEAKVEKLDEQLKEAVGEEAFETLKALENEKREQSEQLEKEADKTLLADLGSEALVEKAKEIAQENQEKAEEIVKQGEQELKEAIPDADLLKKALDSIKQKQEDPSFTNQDLEKKLKADLPPDLAEKAFEILKKQEEKKVSLAKETEEKMLSAMPAELLGDLGGGAVAEKAKEIAQQREEKEVEIVKQGEKALREAIPNEELLRKALDSAKKKQDDPSFTNQDLEKKLKADLPPDLAEKAFEILKKQEEKKVSLAKETDEKLLVELPKALVDKVSKTLANKEKQIADVDKKAEKQIKDLVPEEVRASVKELVKEKGVIEKDKADLSQLTNPVVSEKQADKSLTSVQPALEEFIRDVSQGVESGKSPSEVLKNKAKEDRDQRVQEAKDMGVDLNAANQTANDTRKAVVEQEQEDQKKADDQKKSPVGEDDTKPPKGSDAGTGEPTNTDKGSQNDDRPGPGVDPADGTSDKDTKPKDDDNAGPGPDDETGDKNLEPGNDDRPGPGDDTADKEPGDDDRAGPGVDDTGGGGGDGTGGDSLTGDVVGDGAGGGDAAGGVDPTGDGGSGDGSTGFGGTDPFSDTSGSDSGGTSGSGSSTSSGTTTDTNNTTTTTDETNKAPVITPGAGSVPENTDVATVVHTVIATDENTSDTLRYSMDSAEDTDADDFLPIDANTGALKLKISPDFETKSSYKIRVTVTDPEGKKDVELITINVTDVNEKPEITSPATGTIPEDSPTSTPVYAVIVEDVDANESQSYSLGGTDGDTFTIDTSGVVRLKQPADYETKKSYTIEVTVEDKGGLTDSKTVTIGVTDRDLDTKAAQAAQAAADALEAAQAAAEALDIAADLVANVEIDLANKQQIADEAAAAVIAAVQAVAAADLEVVAKDNVLKEATDEVLAKTTYLNTVTEDVVAKETIKEEEDAAAAAAVLAKEAAEVKLEEANKAVDDVVAIIEIKAAEKVIADADLETVQTLKVEKEEAKTVAITLLDTATEALKGAEDAKVKAIEDLEVAKASGDEAVIQAATTVVEEAEKAFTTAEEVKVAADNTVKEAEQAVKDVVDLLVVKTTTVETVSDELTKAQEDKIVAEQAVVVESNAAQIAKDEADAKTLAAEKAAKELADATIVKDAVAAELAEVEVIAQLAKDEADAAQKVAKEAKDAKDLADEVAKKAVDEAAKVAEDLENAKKDLEEAGNAAQAAASVAEEAAGDVLDAEGSKGEEIILPIIDTIANVTIDEDHTGKIIPFTVTYTDQSILTFSAQSDNAALIPKKNIEFLGSAGNWSVKITPRSNAHGNITITLWVEDSTAKFKRSKKTFEVTVNSVADTPSMTSTVTREDTTSLGGLVVSRNKMDKEEVTHFKVTDIVGGTLIESDGVTTINAGTFVSYDTAKDGLRFIPTENTYSDPLTPGSHQFFIQASESASDSGLGGDRVPVRVEVTPVADTPTITDAVIDEGQPNIDGLVVSRSLLDGPEVTHFQVFKISGGTLFQNDGTTPIKEKEFITYEVAHAGLRFQPLPGPATVGRVGVQASTSDKKAGLGGNSVEATITAREVNNPPVFNLSKSVLTVDEDSGTRTHESFATNIGVGDEDEVGQTVTFEVVSDNSALFAIQPALASNGTLTYTLAENAHGNTTIDVRLRDNGGTANGGNDTSADQSFQIQVNAVADTPTITPGVSLEDGQSIEGLVIGRSERDGDEVKYFRIRGISQGKLYKNDGSTQIQDDEFITASEGTAGLKFTPTANLFGATGFGFRVQASVGNTDSGLGGEEIQATVQVTPVADPPTVTDAETREDEPSSSGLVIRRNPLDETENQAEKVTHFKITGITGGTLFWNDGVTPVAEGTFLEFVEANKGLRFMPTLNSLLPGAFNIQAAMGADDEFLGGDAISAKINILPVADTPSITPATTQEDVPSTSGLVISRNPADKEEVTHFQITNITQGKLFYNGSNTQIKNGTFITADQGFAGLKFTPDLDLFGAVGFGFDVQASVSDTVAGLGGDKTPATIQVTAVADTPTVRSTSTLEDVQSITDLNITPNVVDEGVVISFKIDAITGGELFQNDGTTPIFDGQFISVSEGAPGLKFSPTPNAFVPGGFTVQAAIVTTDEINGETKTLGGGLASAVITVSPVADSPSISPATTKEDEQSVIGLVISRNEVDGEEVTHFKISNIKGGRLYFVDGLNEIVDELVNGIPDGRFITYQQGSFGLRFTPDKDKNDTNSPGSFSFDVQAAVSDNNEGLLQGVNAGKVTATISVTPVEDIPSFTLITPTDSVAEDSGARTVPTFATEIDPGGGEVDKNLVFVVTSENADVGQLFTVLPTIDATTGVLSYTPADNKNFTETFKVRLQPVSKLDGIVASIEQSFTLMVTPVADNPSITPATTNEDVQTSSGLVIIRNPVDGNEITHFGISQINGGTLYQNDGITVVADGAFITEAEGNAGLRFMPNLDSNDVNNPNDPAFSFLAKWATSATAAGLGGDGTQVKITVNAINDAPLLTVVDSQTVNEDTPLVMTGIGVSDVDVGDVLGEENVQVVLGVANGVLTLKQTTGLQFSTGANASSDMTFTGTLVDVNTALGELSYQGNLNYNGNDTVTVTVSDQGFSGTGDALTISKTISISVTPVNDPTVVAAGAILAYTEAVGEGGNPAVVIDDSLLTLTDVDDTEVEKSVVTIAPYDAGKDLLAFSNTEKIKKSWDATTGTLTLTGTDTLINYQSALRTITYQTISDDPLLTQRIISFVVNDGDVDSLAATSTVTITPVNDLPILTAGATLAYTENGEASIVDATIAITDLDDSNLGSVSSGAIVTIGTGYQNGTDVLAFTNTDTITGSWTAATGTLALVGVDTLENYELALKSITYQNTSDDPSVNDTANSRTITWIVTDADSDGVGAVASIGVTSTINITAVNDAPVVTVVGTGTYLEQAAATAIDGAFTLSDADDTEIAGATVIISTGLTTGDLLSAVDQDDITSTYDALTGTLTLAGTATVEKYQTVLKSVTFNSTSEDPTVNNTVNSRTLTWSVTDANSDNKGAETTTGVTVITVTAVNDPPEVTAGTVLAYTENGAAAVIDGALTVLDKDDIEIVGATATISSGLTTGDVLAMAVQTGIISAYDAETGVLTLTGTQTLAKYQTALRSITFNSTSEDPTSLLASRTITWLVTDANSDNVGAQTSAAVTSTIDITAVNDTPVATAGGTVAYTEQADAVVMDTSITLVDADDTQIASATVAISTGFIGGDVLAVVAQNDISGTYNATTGILSLTGTDTVENYQTALRSITFSSTSDDPTVNNTVNSRTITWTVTDANSDGIGAETSAGVTSTVTLTAINDSPVITAGGTSAAYTEQAVAVAADAAVTIADPDDTQIVGATVTISTGLTTGDLLAVATQNGIVGTYSSGAGILTLTGKATMVEYQTALQSVTFSSSSEDPTLTTASRTLTWTITDANSDAVGAQTSLGVTSTVTITAVNDVPVVVAGSTLAYTEQAAAAAIDATLTLSDVDDTQIAGAVVSINTGFVVGDVLAVADQNGITGVYDPSTGVLTLSGTALLDDYQTALQSVTYNSTSDDPTVNNTSNSRTVNWVVTDANSDLVGSETSAIVTSTINLTAVNDTPVVTAGGTLAYTEQAAAAIIDTTLLLTDADDTEITGATVTISTGLTTGDVLAFTTQNGITIDSNTGGVLTLTGTTTLANYQTALRTVTFNSTSDDPTVNTTASSRTITWTVTDANSDAVGAETNAGVTSTINITAVNDVPVTTAGATLAYTENGAAADVDATVTITDNDDTQIAGATVTISIGVTTGDLLAVAPQGNISGIYDSVSGVLTLTGTDTLTNYQTALRSVQYSSSSDDPTNLSASRTVTWVVTDANSDTVGAQSSVGVTSTINVTAVNDAPVATAGGSLAYTEQIPGGIDSSVTLVDVDDTQITGGTVTITTGKTTGDVLALATQNGISGTYDSGTGVLTLTGTATVDNYQTALQSVTFNSTSDDPTTNNTVNSRTITWLVTDANSDGLGAQSSAGVTSTVNITAVNDLPVVASGATLAYTEQGTAAVIDSTLTISDVDDTEIAQSSVTISGGFTTGDVLAFTDQNGITVSSNVGGVLTLTGTTTLANYQTALSSVTFSSTSDDPTLTSATRTITWVVTDANSDNVGGSSSVGVTSTINITAVNDVPVATAGATLAYTEQTSAAIDNTIGLSDVDDTQIAGATVTISANKTTGDLLSVTTQNGISGTYDSATGVLTLTGTALLSDYQAALRSVQFNNTGDNPTVYDTVNDRTITWVVTDANSDTVGAQSSVGVTSTINLTAVNDKPVLTAGATMNYLEEQIATAIDTTITVNDADHTTLGSVTTGATITITNFVIGEDVLAFVNSDGITGTWNGTTGVLSLVGNATLANYQAALRTITYENTDVDDPTSGVRSISFVASDTLLESDAISSTVVVTAVNDAPVITAGDTINYQEDTPTEDHVKVIDSSITITDVDSDDIATATISIATFQTGQDVLAFPTTPTGDIGAIVVDTTNGTNGWNTTTGTLKLTGVATKAQYVTALQQVTYQNVSEAPNTANRIVSFVVNDAGAENPNSTAATATVTITVTNDPPTGIILSTSGVATQVYTGSPNGTAVGLFTATDPDGDVDTFTYSIMAGGDGAKFSLVTDTRVRADTTNQLVVADTASLVAGTYTINMDVVDSGGAQLSTITTAGIPITIVVAAPPFDFAGTSGDIPTLTTLRSDARAAHSAILTGLFAGTPTVVTEAYLKSLILGKLDQQISANGQFTGDITSVIQKLKVEIVSADQIKVVTRVGVVGSLNSITDSITKRIPSSVWTSLNGVFDTLAPYVTSFSADVQVDLKPVVDNTAKTIGFDETNTTVSLLHFNDLLDVNLGLTSLIDSYNGLRSVLKTGDVGNGIDSLTFFEGGGSGPSVHTMSSAAGGWNAAVARKASMDAAKAAAGIDDGIDGDSKSIPTSQRFDYYFPGLISNVTISAGQVTLTP